MKCKYCSNKQDLQIEHSSYKFAGYIVLYCSKCKKESMFKINE